MHKSSSLQEQISLEDVEDTLKDSEFWMYYLDQVEYVPLASAIAGPTNALLKFQKGDSIGAAASASSVIPFYKAISALRGATSLGKQAIINLASEAGIDITEDQAKDLLDRREDVEDDLLDSMTPQDRARAIEDQLKSRDGMSVKDYEKELDDLELQDQMKGEAAKRKPRKKGQKRKSSKHSDLYTDEDPKGTIHGLGFKDAATARKGRAIINKARRTHAHKVQAALVMKQRAKVAKERTKDPEKKKNLNAAYKVWSEYLEKLKAKTKKMKKKRVDEKKRKHPRYRPPRKDPKTGKYDNPCGKGFAPGAQSGVKTKIGPQSGRRVSNCEPIKKKKNEAVVEAVIKRLLSED